MSIDDNEELAYLWSKIKFIRHFMKENTNSSYEEAEKEFDKWIQGLMESRIESTNRMLNSK